MHVWNYNSVHLILDRKTLNYYCSRVESVSLNVSIDHMSKISLKYNMQMFSDNGFHCDGKLYAEHINLPSKVWDCILQ